MNYITTLIGGFILPFTILLIWGKLVNRFGALGAFLSAFIIIGPIWMINHEITHPLIHQSSPVFVDMGLATGFGIMVYGIKRGIPFSYHKDNLCFALVGGLLAGLVISFFY